MGENQVGKFWMVLGDAGQPHVKHSSYSSAFQEAERLTKRHGAEFVVLESKCVIRPQLPEVACGDAVPVYYR